MTETAPVLALNTPMHNRAGTVGRLLPGVEHRLEPVEGIEAGGRLHVRGPNVMLGYLRVENPGVLEAPEGGWHDTGDIVALDDDGFVAIKGRAKRFAKIGGEMVSLAAIDALAAQCWPDAMSAAASVPDAKKGERVILVTDRKDASRDGFMALRGAWCDRADDAERGAGGAGVAAAGLGQDGFCGVGRLVKEKVAVVAA